MLYFVTFYKSKKKVKGFTFVNQHIRSATHQHIIIISEDHVALKTVVMMLKIQFSFTGIHYILGLGITIGNQYYKLQKYLTISFFFFFSF